MINGLNVTDRRSLEPWPEAVTVGRRQRRMRQAMSGLCLAGGFCFAYGLGIAQGFRVTWWLLAPGLTALLVAFGRAVHMSLRGRSPLWRVLPARCTFCGNRNPVGLEHFQRGWQCRERRACMNRTLVVVGVLLGIKER